MSYLRIFAVVLLLASGVSASQADSLTLSVGGQVSEFEITRCRTDPYESGQLVVEAEVTAVGTLVGQPAALFLTKSHHNSQAGTREFNDFHIYITELAPELRTMPPSEALQKIIGDFAMIESQRQAEIMADYTIEKLEGLPLDQAMAKGDEMSQRLSDLRTEMDVLRPPYAKSWGVATVEGSKIGFEGDDLSQTGGEPHEALALPGPVSIRAECNP